MQIISVPISAIVVPPHRDRGREMRADSRLVRSIRRTQLLLPLAVRAEDDHYVLIDGSRRLRAATLLDRVEVPVVVVTTDSAGDAYRNFIVNTARQTLDQLYKGRLALEMIEREGRAQSEVAREFEVSESTLSSWLRVVRDDALSALVEDEELPFGAAKVLAYCSPAEREQALRFCRGVKESSRTWPTVEHLTLKVHDLRDHPIATLPDDDEFAAKVGEVLLRHLRSVRDLVPGIRRLLKLHDEPTVAWLIDVIVRALCGRSFAAIIDEASGLLSG
jgi:ParB/RepB/Spo0J family partition protein